MTRDAIVVGGGIVGAAVAHALSADGARVIVIDAGVPGGGTTAAGMGHIVVMDDSEAQFALTSYSRALLDQLVPALPPSVEYERTGTLWVAEDDAQLQVVKEKYGFYTKRGIDVELLDPKQLAEAEPNLRLGLVGALRVPQDGVIYPPAFARVLLDRARERGCSVRSARVQSIEANAVVTEHGRIEADIIVNAAGAAASQLTPELPIVPRKGHLIITDRYPAFCRHQLVELGYLKSAHSMNAASVAFNLQPRKTGQMLIGSSRELVGWDASINRSIVKKMLARALEFMPRLATLSAIRTWTGFRPTTPDKLPLIGRWEPQDGVWIAAGHEGLGITTALGTAHTLADLIAGRTPRLDAAVFSPMRALVPEAV
jgi:glycine/D-amino acid oxidase-like deaminating enzyme